MLGAVGIEHEIFESKPGRASIVARVRGDGSEAPLLLNGHLDVVPADPDYWTHPPFDAVEADGCIWGRGTIDMKNMVTMGLMCLVLAERYGLSLRRDLIFAGVADEEAGSHEGALFLVEEHPEKVCAEYVLNEVGGHTLHMGNTRFYPIQVSEKGICWFEMTVEGSPGHGSMPRPDNAVTRLARALERLGTTRLPQHNTPVVEEFLRALARGAPFPNRRLLPLLLAPAFAGTLLDILEKQDLDQAIGINAMLRNTASPTMLEAGKKVNVIPSRAKARIDGRILPGQTVEQFLAEVAHVVGPEVKLNVFDHHDGTVFDADTPLYDAISRVIGERDPGGVSRPLHDPGLHRLVRLRAAGRDLLRLLARAPRPRAQLHADVPRPRRAHPCRRLQVGAPHALRGRPHLLFVRGVDRAEPEGPRPIGRLAGRGPGVPATPGRGRLRLNVPGT